MSLDPSIESARELRTGVFRARVVLFTMALVAGSAALISMFVVYRAAVVEQQARLQEIARSQAELIDAVARFDDVESQDANPAGAWVATLSQVADASAHWHRADADVSILVIGGRPDDIRTHVQDGTLLAPRSTPLPPGFPRALAAQALRQRSGAGEYQTSDGSSWLLVHEAIPSLRMAVLVRLDLDVVKRPLRQGLWISGAATLVLIALGVALLRKTSVRTVEELGHELSRRLQVEAELSKHKETLEQTVEQRTEELRRAQAELLAAARLATIGQVTAKVSHELRNPLGTIRTSLHTLRVRTETLAPGLGRILDRTERNVMRCDRIIEELLAYTRPRAAIAKKVNVSSWLKELLDEYQAPSNVPVAREIEPDVELSVDADDLRRILLNLLNNAVDASQTQAPGEAVRLCLRRDAAAVEISVEDHGSGMSKDTLAKAFEPLFSTKGFGIGLGLPIVKELAERNGAGVELFSAEGQGTRAVVRFERSEGTS